MGSICSKCGKPTTEQLEAKKRSEEKRVERLRLSKVQVTMSKLDLRELCREAAFLALENAHETKERGGTLTPAEVANQVARKVVPG